MVSKEIRWALVNTNLDPKFIADAMGIEENECWDYLGDYYRALNEAEEAYNAQAVQKEVREWVATIPDRNNIRIEAIKGQLIDSKTHPEKHDVPKLLAEVAVLKDPSLRPTPQMIERAKAYPIAQLLNQTRKGNVSCPLHKDTNPSLQIKPNNTFSCYSCGQYGDSIHLYKLMHNTDFISAVKALQ